MDRKRDRSPPDAGDPRQEQQTGAVAAVLTPRASPTGAAAPTTVPSHKVGRDLMYERYADAYDEHMSFHDCTTHLLPLILGILRRHGHVGLDAVKGLSTSPTNEPTTAADA